MKISIITATYNSCNNLPQAIQSAIAQHYNTLEHIIIDGGSTDCTPEIVKQYSQHISKFISEPDNGIYDAINKGIKLSTGQVVGLLHSDDVFAYDNVLNDIATLFAQGADVVYSNLVYIDKNGRTIRYWKAGNFTKQNLKNGWMPPHPTVFVRKEIFNRTGYYNTEFKIAADYDFLLRLLSLQDIKIAYLPKVTVKMKIGGASNKSLGNILLKMREDYRAIRNNNIGGLPVLLKKNLRKLNQFFANN